MNLHFPSSTMKTARPQSTQGAHGIVHPDGRRVGVLRIADWLAEGFSIARAQPLLRTRNLSKTYQVAGREFQAVHDVAIELWPGARASQRPARTKGPCWPYRCA